MSSEKELFDQIEELKKKAKDMEEQKKDTKFNKQRDFLINKVRDFFGGNMGSYNQGVTVSDIEVLAILARFYWNDRLQDFQDVPIKYYIKEEDQNMLLERKVLNRYAECHVIRYEDSVDIIYDFLRKIKPINPTPKMLGQIGKCDGSVPKYRNNEYVPLFC